MRLLADENVPRALVEALEEAGHDVQWIAAESPGITDAEVIARASAEDRLLLTFDRGIGIPLFRDAVAFPPGVVVIRGVRGLSMAALAFIVITLSSRSDWSTYLSIMEVDRDRLRRTPLHPH